MSEEQFEKCMRLMIQGDKGALKEIYENYLSYIYSIVYRILENRENAEDVTSEFFIKLWDIGDKYQFGGQHKGWLATIARNMALDYMRKRKHEQLTDEVIEQADYENSRVEQDVIGELTIQNALATLSKEEKEVVNMKVMGDLTFKEIARVLQIPMGTVTWRYQNAIKKLRRWGYE
ncbi:MAG: RNA polymerase sigma factor [Clostridiales bacterium]|nr:RNA polymerase sigma factor [Clostridiales bacterium]